MTLELWVGGTVAAGVLVYLCYVLLHPEKF
jgi:K+-transporting ATPase KdpF subunit